MLPATERTQERLDSWKAIAEYLDRDVATVRRWEKTLRLPVRRIEGASRGHSVFAYRHEIDDWLKLQDLFGSGRPLDPPREAAGVGPAAAGATIPTRRRWRWGLAGAVVSVGIAAAVWQGRGPSADASPITAEVTASGVVARGPDGRVRWRHAFPADQHAMLPAWHDAPRTLADGGVIVGTAYSRDVLSSAEIGGRLLRLSATGEIERTFVFDDRLTFTMGTYDPPWAITDYRSVDATGSGSIAVAAHHMRWW